MPVSREVIPGFVTRNRPEPTLEEMTMVQLMAQLHRLSHWRATPAMTAERSLVEAEIQRREERAGIRR